jgi:hypothetical protein
MPPTVLFQADAVLKEESVGTQLAVRAGERPVRKPGVFLIVEAFSCTYGYTAISVLHPEIL